MAESHNDPLAEYKAELDRMLTDVMPDTWLGHGRLKIAERGFEGKRRTFAHRLLEQLGEGFPDTNAETLAEKVIEKAEEKSFD